MRKMSEGHFLVEYKPSQTIFLEGDLGDKMYIVQEGSVDIQKIIERKCIHLATFEKGEVFGEMALVETMPRSATAIAGAEGVSLRLIVLLLYTL